MARITWRDTGVPSFAGALSGMANAGKAFNTALGGLSTLGGTIRDREKANVDAANLKATEGFQAQLLNAGSPEARQAILAQSQGSGANQFALAQAIQGQQDRDTVNTLNDLKISNAGLTNEKNQFDVLNQQSIFDQDQLKTAAQIESSKASTNAANSRTRKTNYELNGQKLGKQQQGALNDFFSQKEFQLTGKDGNTYPDWKGITDAAIREGIPPTLVDQFKNSYDSIADNKVDPKIAAAKIKADAKKASDDADRQSKKDIANIKNRSERESTQKASLLAGQDKDVSLFGGLAGNDQNLADTDSFITAAQAENVPFSLITKWVKGNNDFAGDLNLGPANEEFAAWKVKNNK